MRQSILRQRTYDRTRSRREHDRPTVAYAILGSFCVLSLTWFLFVSRYWSVHKIEIQGLKELSREEVETAIYDMLDHGSLFDHGSWKPWDRRNLFFIDEQELAYLLQGRLFAESVSVKTVYPDILRLKIIERQRKVVYVIENQMFRVDTQGIIIGNEIPLAAHIRSRMFGRTLADSSHPTILVQSVDRSATGTSSGVATTTGQQFIDAETVKRWIETNQALIDSGLHFKVLEVVRPGSRSFKVILDTGYNLVMDFQTSIQMQIETYKKFIQTKPKDIQINEYVDVRVPGKLYVK